MSEARNKLHIYVSVIRQESLWGQQQTLFTYATCIQQEQDELRQAIVLADKANICEELADVYMMLEFYRQELFKRIRDNGKKKAPQKKKVFTCQEFRKKGGAYIPFLKKNYQKVISASGEYGISCERLCNLASSKLEFRYPHLLPYKQLSLDLDRYWDEELVWEQRKKYQKMMEYCSCLNRQCLNYQQPFDGSNYAVSCSGHGKKLYIVCKKCGMCLPLSRAVLFYGVKFDYNQVLRAVCEYIAWKETSKTSKTSKEFPLSTKTLATLAKRCKKNQHLFEKIVSQHYFSNPCPFAEEKSEGENGENTQ